MWFLIELVPSFTILKIVIRLLPLPQRATRQISDCRRSEALRMSLMCPMPTVAGVSFAALDPSAKKPESELASLLLKPCREEK
jgi:hypothetical protein